MTLDELRRRDTQNLWHPYTDIGPFEQAAFPIIERAEGIYLHDAEGNTLMDGIASWWCVNLGHSHPRLVEAVRDQAGRLQHSILGGMSHPPAIELAARLTRLVPVEAGHVFFAGDGASAVEVALKVALLYWVNTGREGRTKFVCLQDGYHGDTLGAMGVGYVETFHKNLKSVIPTAHRACSPHCAQCPMGKNPRSCDVECFESMRDLVERHHEETAAVILEPLCQGAAGVRIYPREYLRRTRRLCDEYGLLLIADEIAVGFGRTGAMFACERASIQPDLMCVGKGMTGGYLPMSATVVSDKVYNTFRSGDGEVRTLYHGHTFGGNPITSALAVAALDVYEQEDVVGRSQPRIQQLERGMKEIEALLSDSMALTVGLIGAVELTDADGGTERAGNVARAALEQGLFIRPLGASVYLWPPLVISDTELTRMLAVLKAAFQATA
jgi:adenosylmethionine---8-amino-7-oxononanoate aminotransferase